MAKQISIDESEVPELIEFYTLKVKTLSDEIERKIIDRNKAQAMLNRLGGQADQVSIEHHLPKVDSPVTAYHILRNYPTNSSWIEKIKYVVSEMGGEASTAEVVDAILEYEPHRRGKRKQLVPTISTLLYDLVKENELEREKDERGTMIYKTKAA